MMCFKSIILVPSFHPPHRNDCKVPFEERLKMARLAVSGIQGIKVSGIEGSRHISFFMDTVLHFKKTRSEELYMAIGTDQANRFRTWDRWKDYFGLVKIIAVKKNETLHETLPFIQVDIRPLDISSSFIRTRLAQGGDISCYTREAVAAYIRKRGFYV